MKTESRIKYDAFISYRHCEPDREIVDRLHKKLENYRIPRAVAKKVGRKRLRRVFRDEAELAVAEDLSDEIEKALSNSKYLICICSPEYLQSVWCMKEVESFLKYNDKKHILLVLANGEPNTAFPDVLRYEEFELADEAGNLITYRRAHEPLAADCRGKTAKDRAEAVDRSVPRLVAAILGVGYDDLLQRQQKEKAGRRIRRALIAFGVLGVIIGICIFFLVKISKQNVVIRQRYADSLAMTSTSLLTDGYATDAVYAARLALAQTDKKNYSDNATQALARALGIYNSPEDMSAGRDIKVPCSIAFFEVSQDGSYLGARGLDGYRFVIDLKTGETVFSYPEDNNEMIRFDNNRGFVYKEQTGNFKYYDFATKNTTDLGIQNGRCIADWHGNGYAIYSDEAVGFYKGTEELVSFVTEEYVPGISSRYSTRAVYGAEENVAVIFVEDYDYAETHAFYVDLSLRIISDIPISFSGTVGSLTSDGKYIYWLELGDDDTVVHRQSVNDVRDTLVKRLDRYMYILETNGTDVVVWGNGIIQMDTELIVSRDITATEWIASYAVTEDGIMLFANDEKIYVLNDGYYYRYTIDGSSTKMKDSRAGVIYTASVGDNYIATYSKKNSDYLLEYNGEYDPLNFLDYNDPRRENFINLVTRVNPEMDESRFIEVAFCDNADLGLIQCWDGRLDVYNTVTGERVKTFYSIDGYATKFHYDEKTGFYYIGAENVEVFDENWKNIYRISNGYLTGIDRDTKQLVISRFNGEEEALYLAYPVTYEMLIDLADKTLVGYTPDERVKEKYSLE
ncbi:MAG: toll/interleukin-1 receptor domain-containing protein [Lachnospiraceae bacterium]|nr:toll/interleukin-1 receptor domain-containing protein [Lachnospiraceae bacterium]